MVTAQLTWSLLLPGILSTPMAHYSRKVAPFQGIIATLMLAAIGSSLAITFWPASIKNESYFIDIRFLFVVLMILMAVYQLFAQYLLGRKKISAFAFGVAWIPLSTLSSLYALSRFDRLTPENLMEEFVIISIGCLISLLIILLLVFRKTIVYEFQSTPQNSIIEPLSKGWRAQFTNGLQFLNYRVVLYLVAYEALGDAGVLSIAMALGESTWLLSQSVAAAILSRTASEDNPFKYKDLAGRRSREVGFAVAFVLAALYFLVPYHPYLLQKSLPRLQDVFLAYAPGVLAIAIISPLAAWWGGQARFKTGLKGSLTGTIVLVASWLLVRPTELWEAALCLSLGHTANAAVFCYIFYTEKTLVPQPNHLL